MSHSSEPPDGHRNFKVKINKALIDVNHDDVDGRTLLRLAGLTPAEDHILVEVVRPGSIACGLDEQVHLIAGPIREFLAFKFDRTLNFTVDGVGYVWGAETVGVVDLHDITGISNDKVFFLERQDEPDRVLGVGDTLDLQHRGIEHIHSGKRLVTVHYGEESFELERRHYTTEELLAEFNVPAGYVLDLIEGIGEFRELKPHERIKVREGMEFISHAPCGQSS
jgi:hypothetical protein